MAIPGVPGGLSICQGHLFAPMVSTVSPRRSGFFQSANRSLGVGPHLVNGID